MVVYHHLTLSLSCLLVQQDATLVENAPPPPYKSGGTPQNQVDILLNTHKRKFKFRATDSCQGC